MIRREAIEIFSNRFSKQLWEAQLEGRRAETSSIKLNISSFLWTTDNLEKQWTWKMAPHSTGLSFCIELDWTIYNENIETWVFARFFVLLPCESTIQLRTAKNQYKTLNLERASSKKALSVF